MSENIENLKSVLKIRILANTTQTTLLGELFQEMTSRNPKALYILRNLEKFNFFILELAANFNNFQGSSTSAQKLLLTWCCTCIYQLPKALRCIKDVLQNNFCNIVFGFHCFHLDCVLFKGVEITPNFNRKKSVLVCRNFKIWLNYMKDVWFF